MAIIIICSVERKLLKIKIKKRAASGISHGRDEGLADNMLNDVGRSEPYAV